MKQSWMYLCSDIDIFCPFLSFTFLPDCSIHFVERRWRVRSYLASKWPYPGLSWKPSERTHRMHLMCRIYTLVLKSCLSIGGRKRTRRRGANRFLHGQVEPSRARFLSDSYKFLWFPWKQKNPIRMVLSISWHRLSTNLITHRARGGNSFFPANTVRSFYAWQIEAKSRAPLPNAAFHLYALK